MFPQARKKPKENSSKNNVHSLIFGLQPELLSAKRELGVFCTNHHLELFISYKQDTDREPLFLYWALAKSP